MSPQQWIGEAVQMLTEDGCEMPHQTATKLYNQMLDDIRRDIPFSEPIKYVEEYWAVRSRNASQDD